MAIQAVIDTTRTRFFTDITSEFDATSSTTDDPNGITDYSWDFGDGSTQSGTDKYGWHKYAAISPLLTVILTVTNSLNEQSITNFNISVESSVIDTGKQIRRYITQFLDVFNGLIIKNKDDVDITVPIVWGNPDRVVAFIRGEVSPGEQKRAISLPILSGRLAGLTPDYNRSKYNYQHRFAIDPNLNQHQTIYTPTPVSLELELGIWAYDYGQAFTLLETIVPWFNSALVINIGDKDYTSMNNLELESVSDENTIDIGTDQRLVRYDLNFRLDGWLPPNRVVSGTLTHAFLDIVVDEAIT